MSEGLTLLRFYERKTAARSWKPLSPEADEWVPVKVWQQMAAVIIAAANLRFGQDADDGS